MGPATKIFSLLHHDVVIDYKKWTESWDTTLNLFTWGLTKLYDDAKVLVECTTEDVVTLLLFQKDAYADFFDDGSKADGVFSRFTRMQSFRENFNEMSKINEWREKLVEWFRTGNVSGRILNMDSTHTLAQDMATVLIRGCEETQTSLIAPCMIILKLCRRSPVHRVLENAEKIKAKRLEIEERWRLSARVASILASALIRTLDIARKHLEQSRTAGALSIQTYFRSATERSKYLEQITKTKTAMNIIWMSYRRCQWKNAVRKCLDLKAQQTKMNEGAVAMQSFFRAMSERSNYSKDISGVKQATSVIWESYRQWQKRNGVRECLDLMVEQTKRDRSATILQSFVRGSRARSSFVHHLQETKTATIIIWKCYRQRQQKIALQKYLVKRLKKIRAIVELQTYVRSASDRFEYLQSISRVKYAMNLIWVSYRQLQWRNGLRDCLDLKVQQTKRNKGSLAMQTYFRSSTVRSEYLKRISAVKNAANLNQIDGVQLMENDDADTFWNQVCNFKDMRDSEVSLFFE